ncbi:MAG: aspartate aminotransferase family protein, partial [Prosthecobacter sp.]|nr:aspartate aminotransferase family protein [Prosthecobacter sp.]
MSYTFPKSVELFARAQRSIAGGVNSGIRKMEVPVPLYFDHGKGSRLFDVDGNEYIDFQIGQGAILYGHAPTAWPMPSPRRRTKARTGRRRANWRSMWP